VKILHRRTSLPRFSVSTGKETSLVLTVWSFFDGSEWVRKSGKPQRSNYLTRDPAPNRSMGLLAVYGVGVKRRPVCSGTKPFTMGQLIGTLHLYLRSSGV